MSFLFLWIAKYYSLVSIYHMPHVACSFTSLSGSWFFFFHPHWIIAMEFIGIDMFLFLLGTYLEVKVLCRLVILFSFLRNCQIVFNSNILCSQQCMTVPTSPYACQHFLCLSNYWDIHETVSCYGFVLPSILFVFIHLRDRERPSTGLLPNDW